MVGAVRHNERERKKGQKKPAGLKYVVHLITIHEAANAIESGSVAIMVCIHPAAVCHIKSVLAGKHGPVLASELLAQHLTSHLGCCDCHYCSTTKQCMSNTQHSSKHIIVLCMLQSVSHGLLCSLAQARSCFLASQIVM